MQATGEHSGPAPVSPPRTDFEIAVVGGGPAGLIAALLLADAGVATALIAPPPPPDLRTSALMAGALGVLERIGVWPALAPATGALRTLRIVDATGRLIRAPDTVFRAAELGLEAFGHNFENAALTAALRARAARAPRLMLIEAPATAVVPNEAAVRLSLADGTAISARLVVGADGRRSICREAAGIVAREWSYPQSALVLSLGHARPHGDASTEFHTETGPFTLVPLPGRRSSLVAVLAPEEAERLACLDDAALGRELERRSHGILGAIVPEAGRAVRPLGGLSVGRCAARRVALVGEAAHVVPPIGAQGLNMGVRDAEVLCDLVVAHRARRGDVGTAELLARYHDLRRRETAPRIGAIDALNRSLLAANLPAQAARGAGLWMLGRIAPLRRAVMRQGVGLPPLSPLRP